jgi:arsenate reductase-like glutaredoxin family protein
MIQVFGTKKCKETQKTLRFFKERGIATHFIDLAQKGPSPGELKKIAAVLGLENLLDKESAAYRKGQLEYMSYDLESKLLEDPLLLKTPLVRNEGKVALGYVPEIWKAWQ